MLRLRDVYELSTKEVMKPGHRQIEETICYGYSPLDLCTEAHCGLWQIFCIFSYVK